MIKVKSKFWFEDEEGEAIFGEGRRKILELIDELGSMQATAKALNMSYRGVWARIKATEERLKIKLVDTAVGRGKNRGSRLTPDAKKLLSDYKYLNEKGIEFTDQLFDSIMKGETFEEKPVTPLFAIVGPPESGKDDLIKKLVKKFKEKSINTGVIDLTLNDESGSGDGSIFFEAGAQCLVATKGKTLTIRAPERTELIPETIAANYCIGCDLVIVKSEERVHLPTVEIYKNDIHDKPITRRTKDILGIYGDQPADKKDWPTFNNTEIDLLVDVIEKNLIPEGREKYRVRLKVDGKKVPLVPFVQEFFIRSVSGMVSSLKSCENAEEIELSIKNDQ